jgi:hypothetical protein
VIEGHGFTKTGKGDAPQRDQETKQGWGSPGRGLGRKRTPAKNGLKAGAGLDLAHYLSRACKDGKCGVEGADSAGPVAAFHTPVLRVFWQESHARPAG